MSDTNYRVRIGKPGPRRATNYKELLELGARAEEREDDGLILGPWLTTARSGWSWNEGPCPCGGVMRWAEAGYTPWHRICDRCGSHYELYPMTLFVNRATREVTPPEDLDPEIRKLYERLLELVRPEDLSEEVLRHGALWGGWARRARFYS